MTYARYAVYYVPPADEDWAKWATGWLGWDANTGQAAGHPTATGLPLPVSDITSTPRKYGLHATIKPPMRLAEGAAYADLAEETAALCSKLKPVRLDALSVEGMGAFIALRPVGDITALNAMAARCVTELDRFRAPASEAELAKRRKNGLSAVQESNLTQWGYPYVLDQFRFHITLSGRLDKDTRAPVTDFLTSELGPLLPIPFVINELALAGEDDDGQFHVIERYALTG